MNRGLRKLLCLPGDLGHPINPGATVLDLGCGNGDRVQRLREAGYDALGCDFAIQMHTAELSDSGIPKNVIEANDSGHMLIQLDAAYHQYNNPQYEKDHLGLTLSFDAICDCRIPWASIYRIFFTPVPIDDLEPEEVEPQTPHLRLVT